MKKLKNIKAMNTKRYGKILIPLMLVLFLTPMTAFAQTFNFDSTVNEVFQFFSTILTAMQAVLWPILLLMGGLLNNDLLFSGGMNTMLLGIWGAIRDFVNIIFVLGLLFVAIYNIIGLAGENYTITKVLPRIALALIAVNFSFLMAKVVLDAVNVTTTAIFSVSLAQNALGTTNDTKRMEEISTAFCNNIMNLEGAKEKEGTNPYCEEDKTAAPATENAQTEQDKASGAGKVRGKLTDYGKQFFSSFNGRNVAIVMAVMLMDITKLDEVKATGSGGEIIAEIKTIKDLTINTIFALIFFIIYATAFIALFVTLLVRIVVLWVTIAIMPISFLGIAFDKAKLGENDPLKMFLAHALVPVKVAIALTIGMIMITQLKQIAPGPAYSTAPETLKVLTSNMSTLQDIMAGLATAVVIWMAAFWAMKGTKASPIVDKIQGTVQKWGTDLAKLPLYAPILPVGKGGEKVGLAALAGGLGGGPLQQFYQKQEEKYAEMFGDKNKQAEEKLKNVKTVAQARTAIPEVLMMLNHNPDKATQAKIGEILTKNDIPNLKFPGFNSKKEFLEALKEGKVSKPQMEKIYAANVESKAFIPPELNLADTNQKASDATKEVGKDRSGRKSDSIEELQKKLTEAQAELKVAAKGNDTAATVKAKENVDKLAEQLADLAKSKNELTEFTISGAITKDGQGHNPGQVEELRKRYEAANEAFTGAKAPGEAKAILVAQLEKAGIKDADNVAQQIIGGTLPSATAPAKPPAPAQQPSATPPAAPPAAP